MYKGQLIATEQAKHVAEEKRVLSMCRHPFVLALYKTFQDVDAVHMLLELVAGGELFHLLRDRRRLDEPTAAFYAAIMVCVLEYLHDRNIVYRDLKPENVLIDRDGYLKLVDFGFAKEVADRTWTLCGTPEYLAPEAVMGDGIDTCADWWALGILIYEMLTGRPPFEIPTEHDSPHVELYRQILVADIRWPQGLGHSAATADIVARFLAREPSSRLACTAAGVEEVRRHPFFDLAALRCRADWRKLERKQLPAPYVPPLESEQDVSLCGADIDPDDITALANSILEHMDAQDPSMDALFDEFA